LDHKYSKNKDKIKKINLKANDLDNMGVHSLLEGNESITIKTFLTPGD
jgi:hypothetical protein